MTNAFDSIQPVVPLHGLRTLGGPVKLRGKVLLLCCGFGLTQPVYREGVRAFCTLYTLRAFLYGCVVSAANPRMPEYQMGYVAAVLRECAKDTPIVDAVFIRTEAREWPDPSGKGRLVTVEQLSDKSFLAEYDTIVISYPDPLGLGHGGLEKRIVRSSLSLSLSLSPQRVIIINGRGRLLHLTSSTRRMLARHRFLARTRIVESLLGCLVPLLAGAFALVDFVKRRK